ncbi:hypothetical protein LOSG293_040740 [Secundilactobacillus oryzae JCM 18671]|uniref:Uncharacterized protein n=1 Tax=Secundilactobacillus oryzae JCM 18671 TaxID=1291743 RepID=A0A081BH10_9LACO|nr:hypothetical protein LOSG293_040740 [Secundilactobacillus oryzae JCM 18671]
MLLLLTLIVIWAGYKFFTQWIWWIRSHAANRRMEDCYVMAGVTNNCRHVFLLAI